MRYLILVIIFVCVNIQAFAQSFSVHREQSEYYNKYAGVPESFFDSLHQYKNTEVQTRNAPSTLQKRVFGYQPYWGGSAWQSYRWDLLSDLCYFSYEVNPANGEAITTHDWYAAAVIDTALARGVKVHLCVTLFNSHAQFFNNAQARQTLTTNLINMLIQEGAHGINLDFEAVPSSQQSALTSYITELSQALKAALPQAELSIAAPAVNWSNTFDIQAITPWLDLIMIMAYDYYWDGSSLAGPVSGFWPLTSSFDYGVNRSLSYYQAQGVPAEKLLLGLPYYGREWPVSANTLPANTTGNGTAITYRNIRSNTSVYKPENLYWDYRSYNPYYSYFTSQWRQCFFDDERSLGAKYDLVNRRNVAGIGIWALGYDNGYQELWNLIEDKFAGSLQDLCQDTIYDSGGPWWSYGNSEHYTETIQSAWGGPLTINFESLSLEAGYDSLWIYDGPDTQFPVLASLSGNEIPQQLETSGNSFTIRFFSDNLTRLAGYKLIWSCPTASTNEHITGPGFDVYPNPASGIIHLNIATTCQLPVEVSFTDLQGRLMFEKLFYESAVAIVNISTLQPGAYLIHLKSGNLSGTRKILVLP